MKPAHRITLVFLVVLAAIQTLRLLLRWEITVNRMVVPMWASAVATVVLLSLATALWREGRRAS